MNGVSRQVVLWGCLVSLVGAMSGCGKPSPVKANTKIVPHGQRQASNSPVNQGVTICEDDLRDVTFLGPFTVPLSDATMPHSRIGFAVGNANTILKTTDGGNSWRRVIPRELKGPEFFQVIFTSLSNGWAVSASVLLHTTDSGEHWFPAARLPGNFYYYGNSAATKAFYYQMQPANYGNRIYRTADGGCQWVPLPAPFPRNNYHSMFFLDDLHAWVVGQGGGVALTKDGGASWIKSDIAGVGDLAQVQFVSPSHGWVRSVHSHQGGPWASRDGGLSWAVQPAGVRTYWTIQDMQFLDEQTGYLLVVRGADSSVVMKTTDGGTTWVEGGSYPADVTALCIAGPAAACAVGARGQFYRLIP